MMEHPLCYTRNLLHHQLLAVVLVEAVGPVAADNAVVEVVVADLPAGADTLLILRLAVYMPGKCGNTTADTVLHNSMDYYTLDIGSFHFLHPFGCNCKNNRSIKT